MSKSSPGNDYALVIGTRQGSSWSLRPWLLMKHLGIPFAEVFVQLRTPETKANLAEHSPTGQVPVLKTGGMTIWDSMAIAEFLHERHPDKQVWPAEVMPRAIARAVAAEMHSGFRDLRFGLPMEFILRGLKPETAPGGERAVERDITRVIQVWRESRAKYGHGGSFLFGHFSAADAMYAPVVSRFTTYATDLAAHGDDGSAAAYRDMMMALPAMREWDAAARQEPTMPPYVG